jgi:autotransporter translocation and assembly factor TamB
MRLSRRDIIILACAAVSITAALATLFYLNSREFRSGLKSKADLELSYLLGREFSIGGAKMQLPLTLVLSDIKVADRDSLKNGLMLELSELRVVVHPWNSLTAGRMIVHKVVLDGARVSLTQYRDGSWNFSDLLKPDTTRPKGGKNFPPLSVDDIELRGMQAVVSTPAMKEKIDSLRLDARLRMGGPRLSLQLRELKADIPGRGIGIKEGRALFLLNGDTVKLKDFHLETRSSSADLDLWLDGKSQAYELGKLGLTLDMGEVAGAARMESSAFRGVIRLTAQGRGNLKNPQLELKASSHGCCLNDLNLDELSLSLAVKDRIITLRDVRLEAGPGSITGQAMLDLSQKDYEARLNIERFDAGALLKTKGVLKTDFNGTFVLQGMGLEPSQVRARANLQLGRSSVNSIPLDEVRFFASAAGRELTVDQLKIVSGQAQLNLKGEIYQEALSLELDTDEIELSQFGSLFGLKDLQGKLRFNGLVSGATRDPDVIGTFRLKEAVISGLTCRYFDGSMSIKSIAKHPLGDGKFTATELGFGNQNVEKIEMLTELRGLDWGGFSIHVVKDSLTEGLLTGRIEVAGKNLSMVVSKLYFNSGYQIIANSQPMSLEIAGGSFTLKPTKLIVGRGSLSLEGAYRSSKDFSFRVDGRDIDSRRLVELVRLDKTVHGELDFELKGSGNLADPSLGLRMNLNNLRFEQFTAENLNLDLSYRNREVDLKRLAITRYGSVSEISARVPVNLALGGDVPPGKLIDSPMQGEIVLRDIGTWAFFPMAEFLSVYEGRIDLSVRLSGTPYKPLLNGDLSIDRAKMVLRPLGMYLHDVIARAHFNADSLVVDSIKGYTENQGQVMIQRGEILLERFMPTRMYFLITTLRAPVRNIPFIEANVDARIEINGTVNYPRITGQVMANSALITMPFAPAEEPPPPEGGAKPLDLDLSITGSQGIWLRNADADIELKIDNLNVRMQQNLLFLSGRLETIRGEYRFADRRFDLTSGQLTFTNSAVINPELNMAANTFIDQPKPDGSNERVEVILSIGGTALQPKLSFKSKPSMPEQDILTLISAGVKLGEESGNVDLTEQVVNRGSQYLSNMLSGYIQKNTGLLDVVKLKTMYTGQEKGAQVTLGKYVTRNVYVSYSQTAGVGTDLANEFTAEYLFGSRSALVAKKNEEGNFYMGIRMKFKY